MDVIYEGGRRFVQASDGLTILQALLGEHGTFYAQFQHLRRVVPKLDAAARIADQAALLDAALLSHAGLEEKLLFPAIEERIGRDGPIAVMLMEHEAIKRGIQDAMDSGTTESSRAHLLQVIDICMDHFAKEENILFRMAAGQVPADRLRSLGAQWADARGVRIA